MDKAFIHKVKQTVLKHIEDELFGVNELASEMGFSQSQLLRKIKAVTGKTAAEFIREVRLQEAAKLILKDKYTASEISFQFGFSSPSYFNKCFHDYFGVTPGEYKEKFENQIIEEESQPKHKKPVRFKHQKNILLAILSVAVIIISFILIKNALNTRKNNQSYSIAVLPIKNLSNDNTNQYFADGVMDDIMNHLSSIKKFKIISRTTMEQYRETQKTAPEIAKKLNVNYIIESSIQKYKDSVMIIVQLIDAKKDKHLWSKKFEREFKNIFTLESEIAKQIASELKTTLSPDEIKQIEKKPTDNIEAYKLYLKGRFYWHQRTEKDLKISVYYFTQALELDPTYALAYAGLADTYFIMAWWGWTPKDEGFNKGIKFAQKALSINNDIAEAHATLGGIVTWYEWNWAYAEKELKLAISLNSNNATIHQYYSELLNVLGKREEAREQINLALELNPHSVIMNKVNSFIYYNNSDYQEAIEAYNTTLDLADGNHIIIWDSRLSIIRCYIHLNKKEEAFESIKKFISLDTSPGDLQFLDNIYKESGIEGVAHWFVNWLLESKTNKITIAKFYGSIGDSQNTLKYLESAFKDGLIEMPKIKNCSDFNFIKTEPRYIALLKEMNLDD